MASDPKDDDDKEATEQAIQKALKEEAMGKGPIKEGLSKIRDKIDKKGKGK